MEQRTTSYIDDKGNKKTGVTAYNPNTDYAALIGKAEAADDYAAAGYYEQQRNNKIAGQGLAYAPTNKYQDYYGQVDATRAAQLEKGYTTLYDPNVDYSAHMQKAAANKDYAAAGYYENLRNQKIAGEGLNYAPTYTYADYYGQVDPVRAAELNRGYQTKSEALEQQGYLNAMLENLKTTYDQQLAANDEQAAAQTAMQMEALERQKQKAAEDYGKVNRQLYIDSKQTERRLPEQLAALGYTGGATESALLRNRLGYEQALRDNEAARISGEADIDFQGRQIEQQNELARKQAAMQLAADYNSGYNSVLGQMQSQKNYETEQALSQKQTAIAYAQAAAETKAQYGDFSGYALVTDLNGNRLYSDEDIAAMKKQYDALLAAQSFSSGGSGGGRGRSSRSYYGSGTEYTLDDTEEADDPAKVAQAEKSLRDSVHYGASRPQLLQQIASMYSSGMISKKTADELSYKYNLDV